MKLYEEGDIYIEGIVIALAIILLVLSAYWYVDQVTGMRAAADEMVEWVSDSCESFEPLQLDCSEAQEGYVSIYEVFCGEEMEQTLARLNENVQGSYDYWYLKEQTEARPPSLEFLATAEERTTLGDIYIGTGYFLDITDYKVRKLFNNNAVLRPCYKDQILLMGYAGCDLQNAKSILPDEPTGLPEKYIGAADAYYEAGEYLGAIIYSGAAVAFQDQNARDLYQELTLTEEFLPVCLIR
jgi:hypothetical protein